MFAASMARVALVLRAVRRDVGVRVVQQRSGQLADGPSHDHASWSGAAFAAAGCALSTARAGAEQAQQPLVAPYAHRLAAKVRRAPHAVTVTRLRRPRRSHRAGRRRAPRRRRSSASTASSTCESANARASTKSVHSRWTTRAPALRANCSVWSREHASSTRDAIPRGRLVRARGRLRSSSRVRTTAVITPGSRSRLGALPARAFDPLVRARARRR